MATILVVDDNRPSRDYLVALLAQANHRVLVAADGVEALALARRESPDLVIADTLLPVQDGYSLVRELRSDSALAATRVIYYTAHEVRDLAEAGGVLQTLSKSAKPGEVLAAVNAALARSTGTPPALPDDYDRRHLRLVCDSLVRKAQELDKAVSERRRLEEVLQQRVGEVAEANWQKSEFLAILSHELRGPLAPLQSALELIRLTAGEQAQVGRACAIAESQLLSLTRLVDGLLEVSAITQGHMQLRTEVVDLRLVVAKAVDSLRLLSDSCGITLAVTLPDEPIRLEADSARLVQVLNNLLGNAIQFTPKGGRVRMSAERLGEQVVIRIRDNGVGMSKELQARVFDLFTQGDRGVNQSEGKLGIGLTIVRSLVEMHRGYVTAQSDGPGCGSEFEVHLPVMAHGPSDESGAAGRRILVVDDTMSTAQSMAALLQLRGHDVRIAFDGRNALTTAADFLPQVVFLDLGMPEMDGYQVAKNLRQISGLQETLLIAVSGYGQEEAFRLSKAAGFHHHLIKPVRLSSIEELLTSANQANL
jgi:signal transduction histidine kinase